MSIFVKNIYKMKEEAKTGSIGLGTVVFFIFLFMKLSGIGPVSQWSWWWVTSPLWLPIILYITIFVALAIIGFLFSVLGGILEYIYEKFN